MNKIGYLISTLSLLIAGLTLFVTFQNTPKTAYVNLHEVYQEFNLKQAFEQQLVRMDLNAQYHLDSLEVQIGKLAKDLETATNPAIKENFQKVQRAYAFSRQEMAEEQEALSRDYDEKIWKQLNQYVADFAEKEKYDYILGANGAGSIMGGNPEFDLTETIIKYVNQRYHGSL